ncbi:MAG: ankyrin repeat domain-containing protein [Synergistaceae bacterium]|nr:ankyrin repeat domain-containing protein [Synergistaceae bacterium]
MESRFLFLEEDCPKIAEYGRKAETFMADDPNICLLCLGRIAEIITEDLCRRSNIPNSPEKLSALIEKGVITEEISRKISALTETKHDAADESYDSEMACERLMVTAEELCRWFLTEKAEGRFSFLADIFPPDKPIPILLNLSELGREAEDNLFTNVRYCLICLGDMGEAVADRLITGNGIETHERDQIYRIDILTEKYIITDEIKDILHSLRIARNKALHERYNDEYTSESEGRRLLDDSLKLCEWLFRAVMRPGYVVKARITAEIEGGYSVSMGRIPANVPADEIPEGKLCEIGKKYLFKILDIDGEDLTLSLKEADKDYNISLGRLYAKYKPGQDVRVTIKSLSNSTGAIVELKDGLEARIPPSELGRKIYRYNEGEKMVRYDTTARVKWFSLTQYPPMLLSVKDVEDDEDRKHQPSTPIPPRIPKRPAMSDLDFRLLCKSATYEKIIQALDEGANPNATNNNNTTALMMAAQFNKNARAVKALITAGAKLNEQNHRGNTALMYAAMRNTPEVVRAIYDAGADIELVNSEGKKAADYAVTNRKLNDSDIVRLLRNEPEEIVQPEPEPLPETETTQEKIVQSEPEPLPETEAIQEETSQPENDQPNSKPQPEPEPEPEEPSQPQPEQPRNNPQPSSTLDSEEEPSYYEYGMQDSDTEITEEDEEAMRALRHQLQRDFLKICRSGTEDEIAEAVSAGVNVNITNKSSATALMFAAQSNTAEAVEILIHAGAMLDAQDESGNTALIYAASYNNGDVVETLIDAGADREITNLTGHRASDYAVKNYRLVDTETVNRL